MALIQQTRGPAPASADKPRQCPGLAISCALDAARSGGSDIAADTRSGERRHSCGASATGRGEGWCPGPSAPGAESPSAVRRWRIGKRRFRATTRVASRPGAAVPRLTAGLVGPILMGLKSPSSATLLLARSDPVDGTIGARCAAARWLWLSSFSRSLRTVGPSSIASPVQRKGRRAPSALE